MALTDEQLIDAGVKTGLIEFNQLDHLRQTARRQRVSLLAMVLAHYRFPLTALYRAIAELQNVTYVDVDGLTVDKEAVKKIPSTVIRRKLLLPVRMGEDKLQLLLSDPFDRATFDSTRRMLGVPVGMIMTDPSTLRAAIEQVLPKGPSTQSVVEETDVISLLDMVLREAYLNRASDIHIISEEEGLRIRFRVDGKLKDFPVDSNRSVAVSLVSRVKVLADLDIAEQRQPQDGGFEYHLSAPIDLALNFRVATIPTRTGERVTMRVLAQQTQQIRLTDLGMLEKDLERFRASIRRPYGMILLTGPTGSGKSTTLSAALQEINAPDVNIMTVENPIEYVVEGVSQVQTGPKVSFADALRSFLRHDPDVLMVGEIRDHETADVSVKAAMTGHLVFSTLHTNSAVSAITRLIDIGCERFLIGSTMTAVIAQRLVRQLCVKCHQPRPATETELLEMGLDEQIDIYEAKGCAVCQGTGYHGRLGLFETLWFNEQLARLVIADASEEQIEAEAGQALQFMWQDGIEKVRLGLTTLDEVRTVANRKVFTEEAA
jgi:type IV pilus assembly protein PilB